MGVIGSWIGFICLILVLIAQFWVAFDPVGPPASTAAETATNFFAAYLAMPIVVAFYISYKIYYRTSWVRDKDVDLQTGKQQLEPALLGANGWETRATWPMWKVVYRTLC